MAKTTFDDIKRALWAGANTFRDNIDASNYKDYVLAMFFVKYLSDTFDENVKELEKDYSGIVAMSFSNFGICPIFANSSSKHLTWTGSRPPYSSSALSQSKLNT